MSKIDLFISIIILSAMYVIAASVLNLREGSNQKYKLASGSIIECGYTTISSCGQNFRNCKDGKTYACQINVEPQ